MLTVDLNGEAVAYPYDVLQEVQVVNDTVGGQPVAIFWTAGTASALDAGSVTEGRDVGSANAYSRLVDEQELLLGPRPGSTNPKHMINTEALQRTYNNVRMKWDPHFEWVVNESAPWTPLPKPLDQIALALVGTCGAYRMEIDYPFDAANYYGDPSFKEIPIHTPPERLDFAHEHYDRTHVTKDPSAGFPLSHLLEFAGDGTIGRFVDPAISFSGFLPQPRQLIQETAPAAASRLLAAGAEAALLVPC